MPKNQVAESPDERKAREFIEEMATNIAQLSRQIKAVLGNRVKKSTIITLLAHSTKMPRTQVEQVLDAISDMEREHLNK